MPTRLVHRRTYSSLRWVTVLSRWLLRAGRGCSISRVARRRPRRRVWDVMRYVFLYYIISYHEMQRNTLLTSIVQDASERSASPDVSSVFDTSANDASWATTTDDHDTAAAAPTTTEQTTPQATRLTRQQIRQVSPLPALPTSMNYPLTNETESRNPSSSPIARQLQSPHRPNDRAPLRTPTTTDAPRIPARRPRAESRRNPCHA
jgi:hypothetical protein